MKPYFKKLVTAFFIPGLLLACKKNAGGDPGSNSGPGNAKPHVIQGTILDANGNKFKIAGSSVIVHVWGPGEIGNGDRIYNIGMDANSHYEAKVTDGIYAFRAYAYMQLNGNRVCIDLQTLDGISPSVQQVSVPGIVKDFGLQLSGLEPGGDPNDANSYCGGHAWVGDGSANFTPDGYWNNLKVNYPGGMITFTLTPRGPCLDGSAAPAKQINCSVDDLYNGKYLVNFPYAWYRVSAVLTTANGQRKPLQLTFIPGVTGPHYDYLDLIFPPDPADYEGHPLNPQIAVWEN